MRFNKFFAVLLCAVMLLSLFTLPSFAEEGAVVSINSTPTAVPGDTIAVTVDMANNPGIMAMTFNVSYDTKALNFEKYTLGRWNDYTMADHPESGYFSFVNCEVKNRKYNGTIFTLYFTVKDTATPGVHEFKIMNIHPNKYGEALNGCFANKEHTDVNVTAVRGSVTIGKTCSNSGHTFSEFKTSVEPTCIATGLKSRTCSVCGHTESEEIQKTEHVYDNDWTVDVVATAEQSGIMSRHCKNCPAVTDKVYYSLKESSENDIPNEEDTTVSPDDWEKLEEIEKENEQNEKEQNGEQKQKDEKPQQNISFWAKIGNFFADIFKAIGSFFKNLFS